jgi:tetratricopeptide (TPR) repeat protein
MQIAATTVGMIAAAAFSAASMYAETVRGLGEAFELGASGLVRETEIAIEQSGAEESPEGRLLSAVLLIQRQPRTQSNLNRADAILERLSAETVGTEIGVAAVYFRGRLRHVHAITPDMEAAMAFYRDAARLGQGGFWGDMALSLLTAVEIQDLSISREAFAGRFEELGKRTGQISDPQLRKNLHMSLVLSGMRYGASDEALLPHLEAILEIGPVRRANESDTLIRTGQILESLGRFEDSLVPYQRFLERFPRDNRFNVIRARVTEIKGGLSQ